MKALRALCVAMAATCWVTSVHSAATNTQFITHVLYDAQGDIAYFIGSGPWVAQGCSATYAFISNQLPGKDKLLAVVMMAYAAGKRVTFSGGCDANPAYFNVNYVTVQD